MGFLSESELQSMGFRKLGKHVQISDKASIHNADQIEIGDYSRIDDFCVLSGRITLARNVHIAVFCNLAGGELGIQIDAFSGLAYGATIFTQNDDYSGATLLGPTIPLEFRQQTVRKTVVVERFCNIGTHAVIVPGVTLREGTVVGVKSLVLRKTKPWTVYFGIPAKPLKKRSQGMLEMATEYLAKEASGCYDSNDEHRNSH